VTNIPITTDFGGNLSTSLTGKIDITDFSTATAATLATYLSSNTRLGVTYLEVDESMVTSGATTATVPFASTIPAGSFLSACIISCRTAFTGDGTVTIGRTGAQTGVLADANITKTLGAVSGEDPALYGTDLWVPGVQTTLTQTKTTGDYTVTQFPTVSTADDWTVTVWSATAGTQTKTPVALHTPAQTTTASNWTVTASPTVTTYAHPKRKWCAAATQYNAYCATAGSPGTAGILDCYLFYERAVMS
jgi:hypothetical protein